MPVKMLTNLSFDEVEWKPAPRGYYLTDVEQKTLWVNEETGATIVLVKFPPGIADKLHTHPNANQIALGLSGARNMPMGVIIPDGTSLNITPKGEVHGRVTSPKSLLHCFTGMVHQNQKWLNKPNPNP